MKPGKKAGRLRLDPVSYKALCQAVLKRDGWKCQNCGTSENLHIHHICRRSAQGADVEKNLITLCARCHRQVHLHSTDLLSQTD